MAVKKLRDYPVHLGPDATAESQPRFTGDMSWYRGYGERHGGDGTAGRLVSMHTFAESWDTWEVHPEGAEIVVCTAGVINLIQETPDGSRSTVELRPGEYAINAPGVWHTADVDAKATALFITAGAGTKHRPRTTD
ncbi:MAG: cupin [Pseudomonadota bacterium]